MKSASLFFLISLTFISNNLEAKLLDKIAAIVDDNIITLSQITRVNNNLAIKKNVAPMIYDKTTFTTQEILNISINRFLIRAKLAEIGYTITDDQVEAQISSNQERLGVDRKSLMGFLKQQGTSFDEYFETLREAIEYSYFVNRVISPMISISDQDIKNAYYKNNINDSRMNFKFSMIDYSFSKDITAKPAKNQLEDVIKQYRINGVLPEEFSTMGVANLDEITEEGLANDLKALLKGTDEGALTTPILLGNQYHVFYIAKKDLVETEAFAKQKDQIKDVLFEKAVKAETVLWFEREMNKHYIKISL
jgi:peptidyl-prolyl cis-trans isomerase SurA